MEKQNRIIIVRIQTRKFCMRNLARNSSQLILGIYYLAGTHKEVFHSMKPCILGEERLHFP